MSLDAFAGKWKLNSTDKFEEYMKAIGVGYLLRKVGNNLYPVQTIVVDGDSMKIETSTTFKTTHLEFTLNKQFDEVTADDRQVQSTVTLDGEKLIHVQKTKAGEELSTIERSVEDEGKLLLMVLKAKNSKGEEIVCTRKYMKIE